MSGEPSAAPARQIAAGCAAQIIFERSLRACVKGRGGVKGAVRYAQKLTDQLPFVARFDIRSCYESIDHGVLLAQCQAAGLGPILLDVIRDYLALPDAQALGRGMVAGGAISPLLGAVYLTPLDRAMEDVEARWGIRYQH